MSAPKRIQRKRTKGWRMPEDAIYVGRPTRWGNPYRPQLRSRHGVEFWISAPLRNRLDLAAHHRTELGAIEECVDRFAMWLSEAPRLWIAQTELRGRDLVCWCPLSAPCHADVLLEIANGGAS